MRVRFAFVAVALAALLAAGCGSTTRSPAASADFRNAFVEFNYPTDWTAAEPSGAGALHSHPMLYLSVQPTRDPCRTSGMTTSCGWPITRLRPGGVLVVWENRGYPGWSLRSAPGRPLRVGGRRARMQVSRPGACAEIGANETIAVAVERPLAGNWTAVTACLRGPGLDELEHEVAGVLASTRFVAP